MLSDAYIKNKREGGLGNSVRVGGGAVIPLMRSGCHRVGIDSCMLGGVSMRIFHTKMIAQKRHQPDQKHVELRVSNVAV